MVVDFARETALKIIYEVNEKGAYSNITLNKYLESAEIRSIDRSFITELVYGTLKWKLSIDWIIEQFSSVKLKKISPWILNILRLGVYQLMYTDKIPESAACNESVTLSKRFGHAASSRYVNGVLRNIARNKKSINYPDPEKDKIKYLAVRYSHPEWLVDEWLNLFGAEFTESLLVSNNSVPDLTVRVNTLKVSKEQLLEGLKNEGMECQNGKYADEAVIINNPSALTRLETFSNGWFQVQDESSMLVGKILDPKPGELVMDVCSAPGGKSTHIAELMQNKGVIVSRDIHEHKIKMISDAARRLGIEIIKADIFDASELDSTYVEKADRVLVDAPCTGLGIIRRKPDIKWARNLGDTKEIVKLQEKILDVSSQYVKPGGALVYSTCTIVPEENEHMVKSFLKKNDKFALADIADLLPDKLRKPDSNKGFVQLYPNVDGIDGFFIAKLVRVK
ncbi:MAG: 16S rRNA (cytosine(967)-C(5))-methyltransferase RsmB [Clostridia bacterium]|nr:16S rRNA (cytosine(967)-C(5))-methyltransferase RsmB [Clostridia bacterium]